MIVPIVILSIAGMGACKEIEINSIPAKQPITLDGKFSDWPEGTTTFLGDPEASVGVANDSEKIYVLVAFRKPQWARLIRMSGLTVWLDKEGKNHKNFMLKFLGGPSREEIRKLFDQNGNNPMGSDSSSFRNRMREEDTLSQNRLICFEKNYLTDKIIPLDGSQGPAVAYGIDNGFFVYEFSVPLKKSDVLYYGLGMNPSRQLGLGLIWGEFEKDKESRGGPHLSAGLPPGGMGGGGNEPFPDERAGRRGDREGFPGGREGEAPKKQEVWLKIWLADPSSRENSNSGE